MSEKYICPCCGYPELEGPAYGIVTSPPFPKDMMPPYHKHLGEASYDVCDCCGFEFGNDDEPGTANASTFDEYLKDWQASGCEWSNKSKRPKNWSLQEQLKNLS